MNGTLARLQSVIRSKFELGVKNQKVMRNNILVITARQEKLMDVMEFLARECNARLVNQFITEAGSRIELTEVFFMNHGKVIVLVKTGVDSRAHETISVRNLFASAKWLETYLEQFSGIQFANPSMEQDKSVSTRKPNDHSSELPWVQHEIDAMIDKRPIMLGIGIHDPVIDNQSYCWVKIHLNQVLGFKCQAGHFTRNIIDFAKTVDISNIPVMVSRACWQDRYSMLHAYALLHENLSDAGEEIPLVSKVWRMIACEMERCRNHHAFITTWLDIGGESLLARRNTSIIEDLDILMLDLFRERNKISFILPGGISHDPVSSGKYPAVALLVAKLEQYEVDVKTMALEPVMDGGCLDMFRGMGVFDKESLVSLGVSGPMLRASGMPFDTRVDYPYGIFTTGIPRMNVCTSTDSDVLSRVQLHGHEIIQSLRLIYQGLSLIEEQGNGASFSTSIGSLLPAMDDFSVVESSKGELIFHGRVNAKGDGFQALSARSPSFLNFTALEQLINGVHVRKLPAIVHSINPCWNCIDLA